MPAPWCPTRRGSRGTPKPTTHQLQLTSYNLQVEELKATSYKVPDAPWESEHAAEWDSASVETAVLNVARTDAARRLMDTAMES